MEIKTFDMKEGSFSKILNDDNDSRFKESGGISGDKALRLNKVDLFYYIINDIDDFLLWSHHDGHLTGIPSKKAEYTITHTAPSSFEDALQICEVIEDTYSGTYPFKELSDPEYVFRTFNDSTWVWYVYRLDRPGHPDHGKIIGTFAWNFNYHNRSAYNRGLMLKKAYQKKVDLRGITYATIHRLMNEVKGRIDKWYNECRTAHSIAQFLSHGVGAHTHAILPNKDYFLKRKESDALMAAYFKDTIKLWKDSLVKSRKKPVFPEVSPIISYMHKIYKIPPTLRKKYSILDDETMARLENIRINPELLVKIFNECKVRVITEDYDVVFLEIIHPPCGAMLRALHTKTVRNIEKIQYRFPSPIYSESNGTSDEKLPIRYKIAVIRAFILHLYKYIGIKGIEYVEWITPVSDILLQAQLRHFMIPVGYLPMWFERGIESRGDIIANYGNLRNSENVYDTFLKSNKTLVDDAVIWAWADRLPNWDEIHLTEEGKELKELLKDYPYSKFGNISLERNISALIGYVPISINDAIKEDGVDSEVDELPLLETISESESHG